MLKYFFHFYTINAIMMHFLYYFNIIGNTYPVALFVLLASQFLLLVYPGYIFMYGCKYLLFDFILHWVPFLLIAKDFTNINYLYISILLYVIIFRKKIIEIYTNPVKYLCKK